MTISNTQVLLKYAGDGVQTSFALPGGTNSFSDNSEIRVVLVQNDGTEVPQVMNTDFTVSGGNPGSGVSMLVPPALDEFLIVYRESAKTQQVDFIGTGPFPSETNERALDKLTRLTQENTYAIRRALKVKLSDTDNIDPELTLEAGRVLISDAVDAEKIVPGPTADEIANAQQYALDAKDAKDAAELAQQAAEAAQQGAVDAEVAAEQARDDAIAATSSKVDKAGDTMSGDLNMGSNFVKGLPAPTDDDHAATKKYVDDNAGGSADNTDIGSGWSSDNVNPPTKRAVIDALGKVVGGLGQWPNAVLSANTNSYAISGVFTPRTIIGTYNGNQAVFLPDLSASAGEGAEYFFYKSGTGIMTISDFSGSYNYAYLLQGEWVKIKCGSGNNPTQIISGSNVPEYNPAPRIVTVTNDTYTVSEADDIIFINQSAGSTAKVITIPASARPGKELTFFHDTASNAYRCKLQLSGGGSITGASGFFTQGETLKLMYDGSNWRVMQARRTTGWTSYTPSTAGFGTISSSFFYWKREGHHIHIQGEFLTGTTTGTLCFVELPNNAYVHTNGMADEIACGSGFSGAATSVNYSVLGIHGNSWVNFGLQGPSNGAATAVNGNTLLGNNVKFTFYAKVPVGFDQSETNAPWDD